MRGKVSVAKAPLALAAPGQGGVRVTARNETAAASGVAPGQLVPDAMTLCPELELRAADFAADRAVLKRLALWCGRYTPWTAVDPAGIGEEPDGLLLDISGCDHLFGGEAALVADEKRLYGFGLTVRVAAASTPGAAWALARFPRPFASCRREEAVVLEKLPVAALRLDGATVDGLMRLGLKRTGDLYGKPRAPHRGAVWTACGATSRRSARLRTRTDFAVASARAFPCAWNFCAKG